MTLLLAQKAKKKPKSGNGPLPRFFLDSPPYFRHIGVVAGDPALPDPVKPGGKFLESDIEDFQDFLGVFASIPEYRVSVFNNHATLLKDLQDMKPDMVINLCDNGYRNNPRMEMHIPAMLDMLGIPYTGSGPGALAGAYDKAMVGATARAIGVPTPEECLLRYGDAVPENWATYPAFVKPNCADNSFGILENAVCHTRKDLENLVERLYAAYPGTDLILQEFLMGHEYRAYLLGNAAAGYHLMPIVERDFSASGDQPARQFVTYEYKYDSLSPARAVSQRSKTGRVDKKITDTLKKHVIALAERFHCVDHTTFDFRMDAKGTPKFIDLNPNPAWDRGSLTSAYDSGLGYTYEDVIRYIIEVAQIRCAAKAKPREDSVTSPVINIEPDALAPQWRQEVREEDLPQVEKLLGDTGVFTGQEIQMGMQMLQQSLAEGSALTGWQWLFAEQNGEITAFTCFGCGDISVHSFFCHWIATSRAAQGTGLTRELYMRTENLIREMGGRYVYMETSSTPAFTPARRFYLKTGFIQVAQLPHYYKPGDDKIIYCKTLEAGQKNT